MIRFEAVTITYPDRPDPALRDVDLVIPEGELCLVVGPTGVGKSTLLGAVNGHVPHFTGGLLEGRVTVDGRDTAAVRPRDLADVVGVVGQDPAAGFVTGTVEQELAYGMEQLGIPPAAMRKRVEEALDLLGLADLRDRALGTLSGGQQQRVAIGAVLAPAPRVLVLDEPTSALDPTAAEEVLAALTRLVHDLGVTVLVAEHRLERIVQYADMVVEVAAGGRVRAGAPGAVMAASAVTPPVAALGRSLGWDPLPLSVRDGRRAAAGLRESLTGTPPPPRWPGAPDGDAEARARPVVLRARGVRVQHGDVLALAGTDLDLHAGEVVALMGRNGSGKSSLLWALQGSGRRSAGTVAVAATPGGPAGPGGGGAAGGDTGAGRAGAADGAGARRTAPLRWLRDRRSGRRAAAGPAGEGRPAPAAPDPADLPPERARHLVGLVPQTAADLLYLPTVAEECAQADRESGAPAGTTSGLLAELVAGIDPAAHPRDLSEGQRLALALAVQLAADPPVLLLDEPTRGLDQDAKRRLCALLRARAAAGAAIVVSTHDVEFAAIAADRVIVLAQGDVVADGTAEEVLAASPAFAPQVAKVLAPLPWLTVGQVAAAVAHRGAPPDGHGPATPDAGEGAP